jgi:molybdopterin synthase catalytic subunit
VDSKIEQNMKNNYLVEGPITQRLISEMMKNMGEKTDTGGHSFFIGQVRADEVNGKRVSAIEYSAYEGMVKAEADKIKVDVLTEYGDAKSIDIVHSTGIVKAGEFSLFVLVTAGHRHHAIQACSKTVELIKQKLPVWKKEIFDDNSHVWRENQ